MNAELCDFISELREAHPAAAHVVETTADSIDCHELSWELLGAVAIVAGNRRNSLTSISAMLDGIEMNLATIANRPES